MAGGQLITGLLLLGFTGFQICTNFFRSCGTAGHIGFQRLFVCLPGSQVGGKVHLTGTQLHKLPGKALGIGGHSHQLLLQHFQLCRFFRNDSINLRNTGSSLLHLDSQTAAAILLSLQVFLTAGNGFFVMLDSTLQNSDLSFDLLVGTLQQRNLVTKGIYRAILVAQLGAHLLGRQVHFL